MFIIKRHDILQTARGNFTRFTT